MGFLFRTLARPRPLASLAVLAALASLAPSGDSSDAAQRRSDSTIRRVWPVALTGLRELAPLFCETAGCGVGSTATSAFYRGTSIPSVKVGPHGDLYLADVYGSQPIRVVGVAGRIKRVIRPRAPVSRLAVASDGTIAYSDRETPTVMREISPAGRERIVAGDHGTKEDTVGDYCKCGDGGPARRARFVDVNDVAFDPQERLVIADTTHYRIRRISRDGRVETIVGVGVPCSIVSDEQCSPPGTRAKAAYIRDPMALAFGPDGTLWFINVRYGEPPQVAHVSKNGSLVFVAEADTLNTHFNQISITPSGAPITFVTSGGKRPRLVAIDPSSGEPTTIFGQAQSTPCSGTAVALTCGDGLSGPSASVDSTTGTFTTDRFGGIYLATIGGEIRYPPPPDRKAIRLGLVLSAEYPEEIDRGHGLTIRYRVSSPDARVTLRIARKGSKRAIIRDLPGGTSGHRAGTLRWNGRLDGKPAPVGSYLLEVVARSRGRIATRQLVVGVGP